MAKKKQEQGNRPLQKSNESTGMPTAMPSPEQMMAMQMMAGQQSGGLPPLQQRGKAMPEPDMMMGAAEGVMPPKEMQQGVPPIGFRGGKIPPSAVPQQVQEIEPYRPKVDAQRIQEAGHILKR